MIIGVKILKAIDVDDITIENIERQIWEPQYDINGRVGNVVQLTFSIRKYRVQFNEVQGQDFYR